VSDATSLFAPADGESWLPTDLARGPWTPDALHGGPVAALLAGAAERAGEAEADAAMHPARLSVELLRPVPVAPLIVSALVARPGRKVQLVDAELRTADGTVVATARLLRIRAKAVAATVTTTGLTGPPAPGSLGRTAFKHDLGYVAFHTHGTEHRFVEGVFGEPGPATDWIRLAVPVVPDEPPTPLQRVAAAADYGNGISAVAGFGELLFINPDLTIHLHRTPVGEWVCLDAVTWMEDHGTALAESRLWDESGPIGRSLQSLLVDDRAPGGAP
jgi:hypothetical protein